MLALFVMAILSIFLANTLLTSQNECHVVTQAASWQEAIHDAEAGVDLAMAALNSGQWANWQSVSGVPPRTAPASVTATAALGAPFPGTCNFQSVTTFGGANMYGNVYYNGPVPAGTTNVHGTLTPAYTTTFDPVLAPGSSSWQPTDSTLTAITGSLVLTAGTQANPAHYQVSQLTIGGGQILTINPPPGGGEGYIEISVTGGLTTSGSGIVMQMPGVHSTYYVQGDITLSGGSFINKSNVAANLLIDGVDPAAGTTKKMTVSGSGNFIGVIDAPNFDFTISGQGEYSGSLIGHTIHFSGGAGFHHDEALAKATTSYSVASWYGGWGRPALPALFPGQGVMPGNARCHEPEEHGDGQ